MTRIRREMPEIELSKDEFVQRFQVRFSVVGFRLSFVLRLSSVVRHPAAARNSCGAMPVCFRKKRAKWEGSEKARS